MIRAKVVAFEGTAPGVEDTFTFTMQYEENGGAVTVEGVKPEWLPFWGPLVQVDPNKCVGWIVPAQITEPEGLLEVFFPIPPAVADCDPGQPQPGMMEMERRRIEGIQAVAPNDSGNTFPEGGGPI
jgi:hypothetical protein